jgi:hypothetical protein
VAQVVAVLHGMPPVPLELVVKVTVEEQIQVAMVVQAVAEQVRLELIILLAQEETVVLGFSVLYLESQVPPTEHTIGRVVEVVVGTVQPAI